MRDGDPLELAEVADEMSASFRRYRQPILNLTLGFASLNAAASLLGGAGASGTAISIGVLLLLSVLYGGMITALICLPEPAEPATAGSLWITVQPLLARLVWVTLITLVLVLAGLAVLLIPGLIVVTLFAVAPQVVVAERLDAFGSLGRSAALVRGNGLRVFGFILLLGVVCLLLIVLIGTATLPALGTGAAGTAVATLLQNMIVGPLLAIGPAALYNRLTATGSPPA